MGREQGSEGGGIEDCLFNILAPFFIYISCCVAYVHTRGNMLSDVCRTPRFIDDLEGHHFIAFATTASKVPQSVGHIHSAAETGSDMRVPRKWPTRN